MSKRNLFVVCLVAVLSAGQPLLAQGSSLKMVKVDSTVMKLNQMTVADYANLDIPPLDVLYENARQFATAPKYYEYEAEYYRQDVLIQKKKFLDWIRLMASYNYGNMDMASVALMETTYAVWTQNRSSQTNNYYSVGISVSIPLGELFSRGNRIRQSQAKVDQNQSMYDAQLDKIKTEIMTLYCDINKNITLLNSSYEELVSASMQYEVAKMNFANNKSQAEDLYRSKAFEYQAMQRFESVKMELNVDILSLEIQSGTPIISDYTPIQMQESDKKQTKGK